MKRTFAAAAVLSVALLAGGCSTNTESPKLTAEAATTACLDRADKLGATFTKTAITAPHAEAIDDGYRITASVEGSTSDGTTVNRDFTCAAYLGDNGIETRDVDWSPTAGQTTTRATTAPPTLREQYDARMAAGKIQNPAGAFDEDAGFCETLRTSDDPVRILAEAITRPENLDAPTAHRISRIKEMIPILCADHTATLEHATEEFNLYPGAQPVTPTTKPVVATTPPPAVPKTSAPAQTESGITPGQRNAVRAAKDYLAYTAFSRQGLIEQLQFEDYSTQDATFAVDYVAPDWNLQAAKAAQNYLDYTAFSRQGLIDQLMFEGYTSAQAQYGVDQTGL
ncbi:MAG: Ltp family lipoprotein [Rhodococcus sp. (in: high G+C Gram-positive bacteria)]|uniref:Ltp family lipoprotein n=1 Tax=Rhodococcus sp. TaxID=1831 RepID=UPI002ADC5716|nr:Ltp family lipoprotein [Rhodococcus sp. (in: high G+C Gram-positive bacteria)]